MESIKRRLSTFFSSKKHIASAFIVAPLLFQGVYGEVGETYQKYFAQTAYTEQSIASNISATKTPEASQDQVISLSSDIVTYESFYSDLPVASVNVSEPAESWGTVVFLPQYHRMPGSAVEDASNDRALKTQEELFLILKKITEESPAKVVMVEGELAGEVDVAKQKSMATRIQKRDTFANKGDELESLLEVEHLDAQLETRVIHGTDELLKATDRELYLAGAPMKLWAETAGEIFLYGAENKETLDESAQLVRDYLYIEDRLTSIGAPVLGQSRQNTLASRFSGLLSLADYYSLLDMLKPATSLGSDLDSLKSLALQYGVNKIADTAHSLKASWEALTSDINNNTSNTPIATSNAPSRSDNPYAHIQNRQDLERLKAEKELEIEEVVVKRRNVETAENFATLLRETGEDVGVLQYGAGHEEGLVQELLAQGLKVVVVIPNEVDRIRKQEV